MEYKALSVEKREFRILTILPDEAEGLEGPIIDCSLRHEFLFSPPEYRALSYCWGDKGDTRPISIDEHTVQVTTNLEAALRELKAKGYTTLWIDALCINQEDMDERAIQVQWMHLIFSRALMVVGWLGVDCDSAGLAFEALRGSSCDAGADPGFRSRNSHSSMLPFQVTGSPFEELFRRPFWRRVW